ncbi:MAG: site-specific integrase [Eubacterium sp.]|nr:site-specific integrase [Eubacterium sp.]
MSVYGDKKKGTRILSWRVACYYTDWTGERKKHEKRGFATKAEAKEYEHEFLAMKSRDIHMEFGTFLDQYMEDLKPRLKVSTMEMKRFLIDKHIRPYFCRRYLSDINSTDILQWQNALLSKRDENGKGYSPVYLRTIQNHLTAIFNHAVRYYDLPKNPCLVHNKMGKEKNGEMNFWTKEEYMKFREAMIEKPISYYAFQLLYWTGIRCGELLALTSADFDFERKTLRINKNYQVIKGQEMITTPKTEKSNRVIDLPDFICEEIEDYIASLYKVSDDSRIFPVTKSYLHHEMDRGSKAAGVKRIRVHDLRHSSCALLISMGYSPIEIAERLGHESASVTEQYAHLYPTVQKQMAKGLNDVFKDATAVCPASDHERSDA